MEEEDQKKVYGRRIRTKNEDDACVLSIRRRKKGSDIIISSSFGKGEGVP